MVEEIIAAEMAPAAAVRAGLDHRGGGLIINSSRGILYASDPRSAACRLRDEIDRARAGKGSGS